MIYTDKLPTSIDLSESFADYLQYETVKNLKNAFRQMGRRFKGHPRKAQIAKGYTIGMTMGSPRPSS